MLRQPFTFRARALITFDWMAGLVGGAATLLLHRWLAELYHLPVSLLLFIGFTNLAYASVSFVLSRNRQGERVPGLNAMAMANMAWILCCIILIVIWRSQVSLWGIVHLLGEGLIVGWLGFLEWRAVSAITIKRNIPGMQLPAEGIVR